MRLGLRRRASTFDRVVEVRNSPTFIAVPLRQAVLNLLTSCFGAPGLPESLLHLVATRNFRAVVRRYYGNVYYMSALVNVRYAGTGVGLRAHRTPSCTEALVRYANALLTRAASWAGPAAVVCQLPTPALWITLQPVHSFFRKEIGYADGPPYYPGADLLDSLLRELLAAEGYPFVFRACADGGDLGTCNTESLLLVVDEHLSTLVYAFNAGIHQPGARAPVRVEVGGEVRVGGEPTARGAEEDSGRG